MSRSIPQWIKDELPKECCNCGSKIELQYHHIVPDEVGGRTVPSNIAVICPECHSLIHYGNGKVIAHGYMVSKGMAEAKKRGVHIGKPNADYEKIMRLISEKSTQFNAGSLTTEREIMAEAGVKSVCYAKCKRMLFEAIGKDEWPYEWPKPVQVRNMPIYDGVIKRMRGDSV